jgi:hypothetical protein
MNRKRDLLLTDLLSLLVLLAALLAGWREAAAFGLAVLVVMNLLAVLREQLPHSLLHRGDSPVDPPKQDEEGLPAASDTAPEPAEPDEGYMGPDVEK